MSLVISRQNKPPRDWKLQDYDAEKETGVGSDVYVPGLACDSVFTQGG